MFCNNQTNANKESVDKLEIGLPYNFQHIDHVVVSNENNALKVSNDRKLTIRFM